VKNIIRDFPISGIAHITGGGLIDNLPRVFPKPCKAVIDISSWTPPPVFQYLHKAGKVPFRDMMRTFNNGLGMVMVVNPEHVDEVLSRLNSIGETAYLIGRIEGRDHKEEPIQFAG
jgi:phosphoribosylformylglycinamidine cyclo-ligase